MKMQLFMVIAVATLAVIAISRIPEETATPIALFLIIFGIVAFVLAVWIFGFKKTPEKLWWE